jgi:hypothetical protein
MTTTIDSICQNLSNIKLEDNTKIINKGTGAGGANTNKNGKQFEEKTNNEHRLLQQNFVKIKFGTSKNKTYCSRTYSNKKIRFFTQGNLKIYIQRKYNIKLFRNPDEAYIIEHDNGKCIIKILEKKAQYTDGSVETKLWSGIALKLEYEEVLGSNFEVQYSFCVSKFLEDKFTSNIRKYKILEKILQTHNINVYYGDDIDYFVKLDKWIYSENDSHFDNDEWIYGS